MRLLQGIFTKINEMLMNHQIGAYGVVIESNTTTCPTGTKFVVNDRGELIEGDPEIDLLSFHKELQKSIDERLSITLKLLEGIKVFIDPIYPSINLLIFGGGHIAVPLVKLGKLMNYRVTVMDDRTEFANSVRFAEADKVICKSFEMICENLALDANSFVIIITRGHRYDLSCLEAVLRSPVQPAYIGMIGSRRKVAAIKETLIEKGIPEEFLNKVYAPIGLDIGAQTPEEIALSILSEIVMVSHYGISNGLKAQANGRKNNG